MIVPPQLSGRGLLGYVAMYDVDTILLECRKLIKKNRCHDKFNILLHFMDVLCLTFDA